LSTKALVDALQTGKILAAASMSSKRGGKKNGAEGPSKRHHHPHAAFYRKIRFLSP
jgi:hypothetical protein